MEDSDPSADVPEGSRILAILQMTHSSSSKVLCLLGNRGALAVGFALSAAVRESAEVFGYRRRRGISGVFAGVVGGSPPVVLCVDGDSVSGLGECRI